MRSGSFRVLARMQRLTIDEFESATDAFEAAVADSPDIDRFCSSSSWILPAARALMAPGEPWIYRGDSGFLAAVRREHLGLRCVESLESTWGLACPLVGSEPRQLVREAAAVWRAREDDWDLLVLSGIPCGSPLLDAVCRDLQERYRLRLGPVTARHVADLRGGVDAFLRRRSRNFRRSAARARRDAAASGIRFERCRATDAAEADRIYRRVLAVESRSWKGRAGTGLAGPEMRAFYRLMVRRLAERGRQRTVFARDDDLDVGYVLGGVFGATYRGLQFSFDAAYTRISLGTACQLAQIAALCEENVTEYDLGTGMEYKRRWADAVVESVTVVVANTSVMAR